MTFLAEQYYPPNHAYQADKPGSSDIKTTPQNTYATYQTDPDIPLLQDRVFSLTDYNDHANYPVNPLRRYKNRNNPFLPYEVLEKLAEERKYFEAELAKLANLQSEKHTVAENKPTSEYDGIAIYAQLPAMALSEETRRDPESPKESSDWKDSLRNATNAALTRQFDQLEKSG